MEKKLAISLSILLFIISLLCLFSISPIFAIFQNQNVRLIYLKDVKTFAYNIQNVDSNTQWTELTHSHYDMYILEPSTTEKGNEDFDIRGLIREIREFNRLKYHKEPILLAYIDIGQAEDWRWYWNQNWEPGDPRWIVTTDPDGWEGNYPVAFWHPKWEDIVISGYQGKSHIEVALEAGFDGIYLDWIEAFSDEDVIAKSRRDGIADIAEAMFDFIEKMRIYAHGTSPNADPDFLIVAQNAPDLYPENPHRYETIIDAISCEAIWYGGDGGYDDWNDPHGYNILTNDIFPGWTEEVLGYLSLISDRMPIFCVEYAQDINDVNLASEVYSSLALNRGFIPYCTRISLAELSKTPYPPAYLDEENNLGKKKKKSSIRR